jgi:DNA repair protein RadD
MSALRQLREHQTRAIAELRASLASGKRRPLLQSPTGAGKTVIAANIIRRALAKRKRIAFVVNALSLIDQTVAAFEAEGIHCVGVIQGIHERTDRDQPVQVCSIQTIARRKRPDVDLVIIDEAHGLHKEVFRWMKDCPGIPFIGLSATPWARGLGRFYDDLIVAATTADLIREGYLSPFVAFAPSEPDLAGVRTVAGDFHETQLAEVVDQPKLVGDVIETWLKRGENRPTLCYGVNRAHAEHLQQRFVEVGVAAEYIDCFTDRLDRERIFARFRAGETRVICNVATLAVGLDLPMTSCIVDARPTKSEIRFVQTIGRGLRTAPGKDKLVILDHAGNHLRLGMVTDIGRDHLDDGRERKNAGQRARERGEPLPKLCEECRAVVPPTAKACSCCGAPIHARTEVGSVDGELVELRSRKSGALEATFDEKAAFFGELKGYATVRGYSVGWAAHKYREQFGVWPNDPRIRCATASPPSLKTKNWIVSRQIAFAKGRRGHG